MIWRTLPLIGVILFVGLAFCWRSWLQQRRYGTSAIVLFRASSFRQIARDVLLVAGFVLFVGQAIVAAVRPQSLAPLVRDSIWLQAAGAVLMFGGIILLVTAQLHLGASWRIGIEESARPGLVTGGLYRFCRNPIFLALLITIAGYALLLPTLLSFLLLLGVFIGVRQQTLAEEAHLLRTYGGPYRKYGSRVGRFLPGIGRFR